MRLPNSERAIVDIRKITDYILNATHVRRRHKARAFRETLSIDYADAEWLQVAILQGIQANEALEMTADEFGSRWRVDMPMVRHQDTIVVRTVWIMRPGEDFPRLVTCWVR